MKKSQTALERTLQHVNRITDKDALKRLFPDATTPYAIAKAFHDRGFRLTESLSSPGFVAVRDTTDTVLCLLDATSVRLEYKPTSSTKWLTALKPFAQLLENEVRINDAEDAALAGRPDDEATSWKHGVYASLGMRAGNALIDLVEAERWTVSRANDGHLRVKNAHGAILAAEVDPNRPMAMRMWDVYLSDGSQVATTEKVVGALTAFHT